MFQAMAIVTIPTAAVFYAFSAGAGELGRRERVQ